MKKKMTTKKSPKYVTESVFEKHMRSIAQSFSHVNERLNSHDDMFEIIISEIKGIRHEHREFQQNFRIFNANDIKFERDIDNLKNRVEKLEAQA